MTASTTKRTIGIGIQDFETIRENDYFYIDKTHFIKEWWEGGDAVTLITRPRRFGKTLLMNTVDRFLSNQYEGQASLFMGLQIWGEEKFRQLQGTVPVIFVSFADVKQQSFVGVLEKIAAEIFKLYNNHNYLLESDTMSAAERASYLRRERILGLEGMDDLTTEDRVRAISSAIGSSLQDLSLYLYHHYGRKVVILMDEYDTPMQEAYVHGYWDEIVALFRPFLNSTFKTNPSMVRGLMTGITRVSRESMFSDLNNLTVVTTTSKKYADAMGFTEQEVFAAMDEYGYTDRDAVKHWYDGFTFGNTPNIYNPWSILNYLQKGEFQTYWANTSSNSLAGSLIRHGGRRLKHDFECLLNGQTIHSKIDEQIVYGEIQGRPAYIWSLLLASGYLKVVRVQGADYELALTNHEVQEMFEKMVLGWFITDDDAYDDFVSALLRADVSSMNAYMNEVALATFSSFDTGTQPSSVAEPERFYHGFVLGLLVALRDRYVITSNRESGYGRYDVMLEPRDVSKDDGIILEFKVIEPDDEKTLNDTVAAAHRQIEEKRYAQRLVDLGLPEDRIHKYGFAFEGKHVLIG